MNMVPRATSSGRIRSQCGVARAPMAPMAPMTAQPALTAAAPPATPTAATTAAITNGARKAIVAFACLILAATTGCVSSQDIEGLRSQLSDVQRQMLQMQKETSSKQEVESLEASVGKQMDSLLKTEADMQVKLQDLSGQIEALQAKLEDTNYRLAQLSQQIAATNQDLKSFHGAVAPPGGSLPGIGPAPMAPMAPMSAPGAG